MSDETEANPKPRRHAHKGTNYKKTNVSNEPGTVRFVVELSEDYHRRLEVVKAAMDIESGSVFQEGRLNRWEIVRKLIDRAYLQLIESGHIVEERHGIRVRRPPKYPKFRIPKDSV